AGKMPTASAVVADVIDIVAHNGLGAPYWEDGGVLTDVNPDDTKLYVRVISDNAKSAVADIFGDVEVLKDEGSEYAFVSAAGKECELNKKADELKAKLGADAVKNTIQVIF
ncbi:MAG: homoserine dehydrogenase, partial [Clostridia bacterium]|nr:homoserine dehydrogenase [Clostridia bacterium]